MEGSSNFYKSRLCFQVLLLLVFFWLLMVGVVVDNRTNKVIPARLNAQVAGFRRREVIESRRLTNTVHYRMLELNVVSKRRVPNGPDPIHNRRTGNSNRPPGRTQTAGEAAIKGRRH